jgi:hypothetical protein
MVPARPNRKHGHRGLQSNKVHFCIARVRTSAIAFAQPRNGNATADLKHALLVRADGSVIGHTSMFHHFGGSLASIHGLPGDAIVHLTELQSGGFSKASRDWLQVASQASIAAAVIAVH